MGRINNSNQIFRHFMGGIMEINSGKTGFSWVRIDPVEKAMKMQVSMDVCTLGVGQCIQ